MRKAMALMPLQQVVLLLLWQFTIPVLVAIAVAVLLGFLAMNWWLHLASFCHVNLSAWVFDAGRRGGGGDRLGHRHPTSRSWSPGPRPAGALRYE